MRNISDFLSGQRISRNRSEDEDFPFSASLTLEITKTSTYESKLNNIRTAQKEINRVVIFPNEVFSFWKLVGKPSEEKGYEKSRNLVGGELKEDFGGGLCQLAGMIYHLCLKVGLEVVERHNHSVDIYTDETRYYPLGSDASVVYGYKDLRFRNNLEFKVMTLFSVKEDEVTLEIKSEMKLERMQVRFTIEESGGTKVVLTKNDLGEVLAKSVYESLSQ